MVVATNKTKFHFVVLQQTKQNNHFIEIDTIAYWGGNKVTA